MSIASTRMGVTPKRRLAAWVLLLAVPGHAAFAQGLYKCRQPDGSVSYQDTHCAPGTALEAPVIARPPPVQPESAIAPHSPAPASPSMPTESVYVAPAPPLPALYRCTREEGGSYVGTNPHPPGRYVPLWTVDRMAPTFSNTGPTLGGAGGLNTYVEDTCNPMSRREICTHWRQRYDQAYGERQRAFNDTRPALDSEVSNLREQLGAHCGG